MLRPPSIMQDHGAEIPGDDANVAEPCPKHERSELGGRWKLRYRPGKIRVRILVAGNRAADSRQNLPEIEAEDASHRTRAGFSKFQNAQFPVPPQDAREFAEPVFVIRQVAKSKRRGDQVEARVREREMQRVGSGKERVALTMSGLIARTPKHGLDKIAPDYRRALWRITKRSRARAIERKCQIASAAAEIKYSRFWALENMSEKLRSSPAPDAIKREREQMVQKIVPRGDTREHL